MDHVTLPILLLFDGVDTVVLNDTLPLAGDVLALIYFCDRCKLESEQHQYRLAIVKLSVCLYDLTKPSCAKTVTDSALVTMGS